jgi:hypothetical protein
MKKRNNPNDKDPDWQVPTDLPHVTPADYKLEKAWQPGGQPPKESHGKKER